MTFEVELKFAVHDPEHFSRMVESLGGEWGQPMFQVDRYFNHPSRDFARTDEAFRIRSVSDQNYVTYKGPKIDRTTKTRQEIELPLASGAAAADAFRHMLEALGFHFVAAVHKQRKSANVHWAQQNVEIVLDHVDEVGVYAELEITCEQAEVESAKQVLASLTKRLELKTTERRSYLELLLQAETGR